MNRRLTSASVLAVITLVLSSASTRAAEGPADAHGCPQRDACMYQGKGETGTMVKVNEDTTPVGKCVNLPFHTHSIDNDTKDRKVTAYRNAGCTGRSTVVQPETAIDDYLNDPSVALTGA
jgi:hypothetical protein